MFNLLHLCLFWINLLHLRFLTFPLSTGLSPLLANIDSVVFLVLSVGFHVKNRVRTKAGEIRCRRRFSASYIARGEAPFERRDCIFYFLDQCIPFFIILISLLHLCMEFKNSLCYDPAHYSRSSKTPTRTAISCPASESSSVWKLFKRFIAS